MSRQHAQRPNPLTPRATPAPLPNGTRLGRRSGPHSSRPAAGDFVASSPQRRPAFGRPGSRCEGACASSACLNPVPASVFSSIPALSLTLYPSSLASGPHRRPRACFPASPSAACAPQPRAARRSRPGRARVRSLHACVSRRRTVCDKCWGSTWLGRCAPQSHACVCTWGTNTLAPTVSRRRTCLRQLLRQVLG